MRAFYEACEVAMDSKRTDSVDDRLQAAYDIMQPIVRQARARLELRLVSDLWQHLRWTTAWAVYNMAGGKGKWPGFIPVLCCGAGTTLVYPPAPAHRTSLGYRWSKWQDLPESFLPSVPMRSGWPVVRN